MTIVATHIDWVIDELFSPEDRRYKQMLDAIIKKQQEYVGNTIYGITWQGVIFALGGFRDLPLQQRPSLHESLWEEMQLLWADRQKILSDKTTITQVMRLALSYCSTCQEARDTLPDCMWARYWVKHSTTNFDREFPVGYALRNEPRQHRQFLAAVPLMELYCVTHLMY